MTPNTGYRFYLFGRRYFFAYNETPSPKETEMTIIPNEERDSFGMFIAKELVLSTVVSTGVVLGFICAGHVMIAVDRLKMKRKAKKEAPKAE